MPKSGVVDFSHQYTRLCDASIGLLRYGSDVEVIAPALDFYLLQMTLSGEIAMRSSQFDLTLGQGTVFVTNPGVAYRKYWSRDARQLMIKKFHGYDLKTGRLNSAARSPVSRLCLQIGPIRSTAMSVHYCGWSIIFAETCRMTTGCFATCICAAASRTH